MRISSQILMTTLGVCVVSTLAAVAPLVSGTVTLMHDAEAERLRLIRDEIRAHLNATYKQALGEAVTIASIPAAQRAVAENDSDALHGLFGASLEILQEKTGVEKIQFHLRSGRSLYRTPPLETPGAADAIVRAANAQKTVLAGLAGESDGVGMHGVAPIFHNGAHVGSVEVDLMLDNAFLAELLDSDVARAEIYLFGSEGDGVRRIAASFDADPLLDAAELSAIAAGLAAKEIILNLDTLGEILSADYVTAYAPLVDYAGKVIGVIHILSQSAGGASEIRGMAVTTLVAVLAALAAAAVAAMLLSQRIGARIQVLGAQMRRLAAGDVEFKVRQSDRSDEIGEMAQALAVFQTNRSELAKAERQAADAQKRADEQRGKTIETLRQNVSEAISAGARGDFSQRVANAPQDLLWLADGVNELMRVTDNGLRDVTQTMNALARGELYHRMEGAHEGRFGEFQRAANQAIESFARIISNVATLSEDFSETSNGLRGGAATLSSAAESQAATLQQINATLEGFRHTTRGNLTKSEEAASGADETADLAHRGAQAMHATIEAISNLKTLSADIAAITGVIDGIAFQTNLLALNAAVEAARAGDTGKGFAVVANEVRALASRASDSSKQIQDLIDQSVAGIGSTAQNAEHAEATLKQIVAAVDTVGERIAQLATANKDLAGGVEEISSAVADLDKVAQRAAERAAQNAESSEDLANGGALLAEAAGQFRLAQPVRAAG